MVSASAFGAKFTTKPDVYRFLASEAKIYLPHYDTVTIWHLKELMSGQRKRIKCDDVKFISVPFFEGISVENMLEFASNFLDAMLALPARGQSSLPFLPASACRIE